MLNTASLELKPLEELFVGGLLEVLGRSHTPLRAIHPMRDLTDCNFLEPQDQNRFMLLTRPDLGLCYEYRGAKYRTVIRVRIECGEFTEGNDPRGAGPLRFSESQLHSSPEACAYQAVHYLEAQARAVDRT